VFAITLLTKKKVEIFKTLELRINIISTHKKGRNIKYSNAITTNIQETHQDHKTIKAV